MLYIYIYICWWTCIRYHQLLCAPHSGKLKFAFQLKNNKKKKNTWKMPSTSFAFLKFILRMKSHRVFLCFYYIILFKRGICITTTKVYYFNRQLSWGVGRLKLSTVCFEADARLLEITTTTTTKKISNT